MILEKNVRDLESCPRWLNSYGRLEPNLSIIGNISKSISILIMNGGIDSQTPIQQTFLIQ